MCYLFAFEVADHNGDWRPETPNAAQAEYNRLAALLSHQGPEIPPGAFFSHDAVKCSLT